MTLLRDDESGGLSPSSSSPLSPPRQKPEPRSERPCAMSRPACAASRCGCDKTGSESEIKPRKSESGDLSPSSTSPPRDPSPADCVDLPSSSDPEGRSTSPSLSPTSPVRGDTSPRTGRRGCIGLGDTGIPVIPGWCGRDTRDKSRIVCSRPDQVPPASPQVD